ncbi:hypothetical protein R3P38DRAFT_3368362 [Favolaschia claudopus]|uniref:Uncharacterized protein n=1 Tax=Favolaschia claudopus TaxID=2862362 RepID=A0AAW0A6K5_9AGAR
MISVLGERDSHSVKTGEALGSITSTDTPEAESTYFGGFKAEEIKPVVLAIHAENLCHAQHLCVYLAGADGRSTASASSFRSVSVSGGNSERSAPFRDRAAAAWAGPGGMIRIRDEIGRTEFQCQRGYEQQRLGGRGWTCQCQWETAQLLYDRAVFQTPNELPQRLSGSCSFTDDDDDIAWFCAVRNEAHCVARVRRDSDSFIRRHYGLLRDWSGSILLTLRLLRTQIRLPAAAVFTPPALDADDVIGSCPGVLVDRGGRRVVSFFACVIKAPCVLTFSAPAPDVDSASFVPRDSMLSASASIPHLIHPTTTPVPGTGWHRNEDGLDLYLFHPPSCPWGVWQRYSFDWHDMTMSGERRFTHFGGGATTLLQNIVTVESPSPCPAPSLCELSRSSSGGLCRLRGCRRAVLRRYEVYQRLWLYEPGPSAGPSASTVFSPSRPLHVPHAAHLAYTHILLSWAATFDLNKAHRLMDTEPPHAVHGCVAACVDVAREDSVFLPVSSRSVTADILGDDGDEVGDVERWRRVEVEVEMKILRAGSTKKGLRFRVTWIGPKGPHTTMLGMQEFAEGFAIQTGATPWWCWPGGPEFWIFETAWISPWICRCGTVSGFLKCLHQPMAVIEMTIERRGWVNFLAIIELHDTRQEGIEEFWYTV